MIKGINIFDDENISDDEVINISDDYNITIEIKVFDEGSGYFLTSYNHFVLEDKTVHLIMDDVAEHLSYGTWEHAHLRSKIINIEDGEEEA